MVSRVIHSKGASQLLLPICLCTDSIAVQRQGLLPFLHHLMTDLPLAGARHRHLHQRLGLPAVHVTIVSILVISMDGNSDKMWPKGMSAVDACFCRPHYDSRGVQRAFGNGCAEILT